MKKAIISKILVSALVLSLTAMPVLADNNELTNVPDWYPADPGSFVPFHDASAPRVVDRADLFTDEEEKLMADKISDISTRTQKDVVIVTDDYTYRLGGAVPGQDDRDLQAYAEDFYDYLGYGIGDTYDGILLFISMDPDDRGIYTCGTGVVQDMHTENMANALDDIIYPYLRQGNFGPGAIEWVNAVDAWFTHGYLKPSWYPEDPSSFVRFHNENAPAVIDLDGSLSAEELADLNARAMAVAEETNIDILIILGYFRSDMLPEEASGEITDMEDRMAAYAKAYYIYNGYGKGENYDGLAVYFRDDYPYTAFYGSGCMEAKLKKKVRNRLETKLIFNLSSDGNYKCIGRYIDTLPLFFKYGLIPHGIFTYLFWLILCLISGSITGNAALSAARKKQNKPVVMSTARDYVVNGTLQVQSLSDKLIDTRVERKRKPKPSSGSGSSRSSSGSSHRSSHTSSHTGHSGRSHSGSSRRF